MLCVLTVATLYFRDTRKPTVSLSAVGKSDVYDVGSKQRYCCMPLLLLLPPFMLQGQAWQSTEVPPCVIVTCRSSLRGSCSQLLLEKQNSEEMWSPLRVPGMEGIYDPWTCCPDIGEQPHGASSVLNHPAALLVLGCVSVISSRPFMFD